MNKDIKKLADVYTEQIQLQPSSKKHHYNGSMKSTEYVIYSDIQNEIEILSKLNVEYSSEEDLVKQLLCEYHKSEEAVIEYFEYVDNEKLTIDEIVENVIRTKDEYGYTMHHEGIMAVSEDDFYDKVEEVDF